MQRDPTQRPHQDLAHCLWFDGIEPALLARPSLDGDLQTDIAIVGAGFTGLWTALFLAKHAPSLKITLFEAHHVGFGASGRNGGWLMGSLEGMTPMLARCTAAQKLQALAQLRSLVNEVKATLVAEDIKCDLAHGGAVLGAARFQEQAVRARDALKELHQLGFDDQDYNWLSGEESYARVAAAGSCGGIYTPHVATLNPAKLVMGLARAVERRGVVIYENSPVTDIESRKLRTAQGDVLAKHIVIATEGFTQSIPQLERRLLPVQSGMVATEPLPAALWAQLGFQQREAFSDFSRISTYLQRTADDRLIIGARGSYKFGGKVVSQFSNNDADFRRRAQLKDLLFPILKHSKLTHTWGGTLAVPRGFSPHIVVDEASGMSTAGGYLGEGVGASYLFGKTLATIIINGASEEAFHGPWVKYGTLAAQLKPWEPEPLPWLGFNATMTSYGLEEWAHSQNQHPSIKKLTTWLANTVDAVVQNN